MTTIHPELQAAFDWIDAHRNEAIAIASRVVFIERGSVVREGTVDDLRSTSNG